MSFNITVYMPSLQILQATSSMLRREGFHRMYRLLILHCHPHSVDVVMRKGHGVSVANWAWLLIMRPGRFLPVVCDFFTAERCRHFWWRCHDLADAWWNMLDTHLSFEDVGIPTEYEFLLCLWWQAWATYWRSESWDEFATDDNWGNDFRHALSWGTRTLDCTLGSIKSGTKAKTDANEIKKHGSYTYNNCL